MTSTVSEYTLEELKLETTLGGMGRESEREIPVIDLSGFDRRREEITEQLWQAAPKWVFSSLPIMIWILP